MSDRQATAQQLIDISRRRMEGVHPLVVQRVLEMIRLMAADGLYFGAFMGLRTYAEQDALYAQGRTKPGRRVTNARGGQSYHNFGLSVDLVEDGDPNKTGIQWSWSNNANYVLLGNYARHVGLEWGGWWKAFTDYPHVQQTGGLSLEQARRLYQMARNTDPVWDAVDRRLKAA